MNKTYFVIFLTIGLINIGSIYATEWAPQTKKRVQQIKKDYSEGLKTLALKLYDDKITENEFNERYENYQKYIDTIKQVGISRFEQAIIDGSWNTRAESELNNKYEVWQKENTINTAKSKYQECLDSKDVTKFEMALKKRCKLEQPTLFARVFDKLKSPHSFILDVVDAFDRKHDKPMDAIVGYEREKIFRSITQMSANNQGFSKNYSKTRP